MNEQSRPDGGSHVSRRTVETMCSLSLEAMNGVESFPNSNLAADDEARKEGRPGCARDQMRVAGQISHLERLPLAGYPIVTTTATELNAILQQRLTAARKTVLCFANTNFVLQCRPMRFWLGRQEVIIANDGIGLDLAALAVHGHRYQANLNGTDFLPYFLRQSTVRRKIYLLGAKPGVAQKAGIVMERELGQQVIGCLHGYSKLDPVAVCNEINRSGAEIVFVAMGNPLQEEWIRANMYVLDAKLFVGVGALFDFLSGEARRAPAWIQRIHCEWLFRLCQEPTRLMRRYTLDIVSFLFVCLQYGRTTITELRRKPDRRASDRDRRVEIPMGGISYAQDSSRLPEQC